MKAAKLWVRIDAMLVTVCYCRQPKHSPQDTLPSWWAGVLTASLPPTELLHVISQLVVLTAMVFVTICETVSIPRKPLTQQASLAL
jgi:hypothetical protein